MYILFMEQRAFGEAGLPIGQKPIPARLLADTCIPANFEVMLIMTGGDRQPLEAIGFEVLSLLGGPDRPRSFLTGRVSPSRIVDLVRLPQVVRIELPEPMFYELDDSTKFARVKALRSAHPEATGAGVVIAVIDSGIDWTHGTFRDASGRTRVVGLWDMDMQRQGDEISGPGNRGVVYTASDIDFSLGFAPLPSAPTPVKVRHRDRKSEDERDPHGTLVAGVAAGNGSPAACCRPGGGKYVGVAPEADLLVVRLSPWVLDSNSLLQALTFIADHPATEGRPIVVNISNGLSLGPHDGTASWEAAIETFLDVPAGQPTRAVVKSAGNDAKAARHISTRVAPGAMVHIPILISQGQHGTSMTEFWSALNSSLDIEVLLNDNTLARFSQPVEARRFDLFDAGGGYGHLAWATANANGDLSVSVRIAAVASGSIAPGDWAINVHNVGGVEVQLDGWIARGGAKTRFMKHGDVGSGVRASAEGTITTPGTSKNVITVASHSVPGWFSSLTLDDTSGRGPVRGHTTDNAKPTLAAPGVDITSAQANATHILDCCCPDWTEGGGTSMAAPHVAGAIALMLQKNPTLPLAQVRQILVTTAAGGDRGAPEAWGAGHLNVDAAWESTPSPEGPIARVAVGPDLASTAPVVARARLPASEHPLVAAGRRGLPTNDGATICTALMSRYFSEARRLINGNRRIATLWHRADGPGMLRRIALPSGPPGLLTEDSRAYFERFLGQLRRYGSPSLRAAIEQHETLIVKSLEGGPDRPLRERHRVPAQRARVVDRTTDVACPDGRSE